MQGTKLRKKQLLYPQFQNSVDTLSDSHDPKMAAITKNRIFFKWPNCFILSQNVSTFELHKHNDEFFNICYRIFYVLLPILIDYAN